MARQLRVEFPGAIYHVCCHMVGDWLGEKTRLFRDDADRVRFLDRLGERVEQYKVRLYLFVCMTNHFHLVFETPQANCSRFMQSVSTAYTVYYNLRHGRHGHVLDGRYKARLVEGDKYLLRLSRYVHLNPVQVGGFKVRPIAERILALRAYRWSSYPGYIGAGKKLEFVEYGPLLGEMSGKLRGRPKRYREFVEAGLGRTDEELKAAMTASARSIGGEEFRTWVDELYGKRVVGHGSPEDVSFRRVCRQLPAERVLELAAEGLGVGVEEFGRRRRKSAMRGVAARLLVRYGGLTQREAARALNMGSGSAVCKQLVALPAKLEADGRLREQLAGLEATLESARAGQKGVCTPAGALTPFSRADPDPSDPSPIPPRPQPRSMSIERARLLSPRAACSRPSANTRKEAGEMT